MQRVRLRGDRCRASGQASDRRMEMWHLCYPTLARNPQMQMHKTSTAPPLFRKNNTQVHGGTFITIPTLIWERTPQVQWKHFRRPFSLYGPPSACISCSASYIDKHRFVAPGCVPLSHYSKCQLCKWSTVRLSSHISCVIALVYLFWCGIHAWTLWPVGFDHFKHGI